MAIHYTCTCGARVRMSDRAAGKRARCRSCGSIFTVPPGPSEPAKGSSRRQNANEGESAQPRDERYSWLEEFAEAESGTDQPPPVVVITDVPEAVDLSEATPPPRRRPEERYPSPDEGRNGVIGPRQSFWRDLIESFTFFMTPGNLITFMLIIFLNILTVLLNVFTIPLPYGRLMGLVGSLFVFGYLCSFYLLTILETAAGEDDLPEVWMSSLFDDLFVPLVHFLATWVWVLLPALAVILIASAGETEVPWTLVRGVAVAGLFFWPVVILAVAIGRGFKGLWPHVIIRTALAAPLAYLAVCSTLAVAAALLLLPSTDMFQSAVNRVMPGAMAKVTVLNSVLTAYAMIVAMRVIGLFYRHFKHKFPWVAE